LVICWFCSFWGIYYSDCRFHFFFRFARPKSRSYWKKLPF